MCQLSHYLNHAHVRIAILPVLAHYCDLTNYEETPMKMMANYVSYEAILEEDPLLTIQAPEYKVSKKIEENRRN